MQAYQYHSEGLHGLRSTCGLGPGKAPLYSTMFPQVTGMAATGNLTLMRAMAAHMGDEGRAVNNIMVAHSEQFPGKVRCGVTVRWHGHGDRARSQSWSGFRVRLVWVQWDGPQRNDSAAVLSPTRLLLDLLDPRPRHHG